MASPSLWRLLAGPKPTDDLDEHCGHVRTLWLGMALGGAMAGLSWLGDVVTDVYDPAVYWFAPLAMGGLGAFVVPVVVRQSVARKRAKAADGS